MSETDNGKGSAKRYNVVEAAEILNTSTEAVRQRIRRGTLEATREAGRVYVSLSPEQTDTERTDDPRGSTPVSRNTSGLEEMVDKLTDEVHFLRARLEDAEDRDREMRWMMGALAGRIRELPSVAGEGEASKEPPPDRASWWTRIFG